ncbi:MAG: hypothetical protein R2778_06950 [Saprospiraceae bacterium]
MGLYWDLLDDSPNESASVLDLTVNGISPGQVFSALSTHTSIQQVKDDILSNADPADIPSINSLFAEYGY